LDSDDNEPSSSKKNDANNGPGKCFPGGIEGFRIITGSHDTNTREDDHEEGGENDESGDGLNNISENTKDTLEGGDFFTTGVDVIAIIGPVGGSVSSGNEFNHGFDYTKKAAKLTALF